MRTNVYIDGFNLYYGAVKGTLYKWLDLSVLCRLLLPRNSINRIRYFTARVHGTAADQQKPVRQDAYLRALETIPNLTVHEGRFLSSIVRMPLAYPAPGGPRTIEVVKTEEKGSDVKLATYLLLDGFAGDYEAAVVISNDSDLEEPIVVANKVLGLPVGVLNPHKHPSRELLKVATFYKPIRVGVLKASPSSPSQVRG